ncbi:hypothetical protein D3C76_47930 [compost metagenome]
MSTRIALDLTKYHFCRTHGELCVYGTWFGDNHRPALVLVPKNHADLLGRGYAPFVIPLDNAWIWSEEVGDERLQVASAATACKALGLDFLNRFTLLRILCAIRDNMGDLLKMPPKPTETVVVADAFRTDRETGKVRHLEIKENV